MEDDCFTIVCWLLPHSNMNQPQVRGRPPTRPPPASLPIPPPGITGHAADSRWLWLFHTWWGIRLHATLNFSRPHTYREGNGTPLQDSCLENPMDGGAWWAAVHGVAKSRTRLSNFTFTFHFRALEKEMAAHSSVLAWRIPGPGEPGGLPSMGSHRVGRG